MRDAKAHLSRFCWIFSGLLFVVWVSIMRGTLAELASIEGMPSEPTLRKMIAGDPDFRGIVKRGSNGDAYEIELEEAARYIVEREQAKVDAERARQSELAQLGLNLGLGVAKEQAGSGFTIADRKALLEEEVVAMRLGKLRGELIDKASVETAVSQFLVKVRDLGTTFGARLAKRADVSRSTLIEIERLMEDDQATLARWMRELGTIGTPHDDADIDGALSAAASLDRPAA